MLLSRARNHYGLPLAWLNMMHPGSGVALDKANIAVIVPRAFLAKRQFAGIVAQHRTFTYAAVNVCHIAAGRGQRNACKDAPIILAVVQLGHPQRPEQRPATRPGTRPGTRARGQCSGCHVCQGGRRAELDWNEEGT